MTTETIETVIDGLTDGMNPDGKNTDGRKKIR